jgi:hypothetical protein
VIKATRPTIVETRIPHPFRNENPHVPGAADTGKGFL